MPLLEIVEHLGGAAAHTLEYVEQNAVALDAVSGAMAGIHCQCKTGRV
ncbi:MAG: hypothetical protein ACYYK0_01790 [Candidatus Eutrophobiaceae bacterium]